MKAHDLKPGMLVKLQQHVTWKLVARVSFRPMPGGPGYVTVDLVDTFDLIADLDVEAREVEGS